MNYRNDGEATFRNQAATVNISVAKSKPLKVTMDTGSTGIAISRKLLPENALNGLTSLGAGAINYDSSGVTPTGTFYQLPIEIFGKNSVTGEHAVGTTSVKVLVVDSDTTYMGIGNNRNNVYSGTFNPALTFKQNVAAGNIVQISAVGMNPLIDVAINDKALPNQGYVVMNDQVVIGLTTQNNTYSFIKLAPDPANGPQMWGTIPMTLSPIPGPSNGPAIGDLLPDTGIDHAYLNPYRSGLGKYKVEVSLPGIPPQQAVFYSFMNDPTSSKDNCTFDTDAPNAMQPCYQGGGISSTGFINTGRQFYSGFNYLFDPVNGYAGFALSSSGLPTTAKITPLLALTGTVALPNGLSLSSPLILYGPTTLTTTQSGNVALNAAVQGDGNGLSLSGGGLFSFNAPINLGSGALSLQQGAAAIGGGLNAGSIVVSTEGTLTNMEGSTIVAAGGNQNDGRFINNGILSGNLSNSGTLGGNGTITGDLANSGLIAPGNSIGTLTINGNYSKPGGSMAVEIQGPQNDQIVVTGTVAPFSGTASLISFGGGTAWPVMPYPIITASTPFATSTSLTLDQSLITPSALLQLGTTLIQEVDQNPRTFEVQWRPNNGSGAVASAMQALGAAHGNGSSAAGVFDGAFNRLAAASAGNINATGAAIGATGFTTGQAAAAGLSPDFVNRLAALLAIPGGAQLQQAVNSMTPESYAAFQSVGLNALRLQRETLNAQAGSCRETGWLINASDTAASSGRQSSTAGKTKMPVCAFATGGNATSTINSSGSLSGYNSAIAGGFYGIEVQPSTQWTVGAAYGYGTAALSNLGAGLNTVSSTLNSVSLYGVYKPDTRWSLKTLLGYTNAIVNGQRNLIAIGNGSPISGNTTGNGYTAAVLADYAISLTKPAARVPVALKPQLGLAYGAYQQNGFSETGDPTMNLTVATHTSQSLIGTVGAELVAEIPLNKANSQRLKPRLAVAYQVDALANSNGNTSVDSTLPASGAAFTTNSLGRGANDLTISGSLEYVVGSKASLYASASYEAFSTGSQFAYGGGVKVSF